ncbi:MAG: RraA family protein [Nitrososphaerota archaeon]|nr:RraA family protein [Nitrososphaerota archaeon]MDG6947245.1 RraA family protein [Nitrososphaerota archaeon]MDG6955322.1 RraA family protein [Nitrososphaerota archaeon]
MHIVNPHESVIELTRLNPYGRFPDGRPRVPDELVERMKDVTTEQAWGVLHGHGFTNQFEGNWLRSHPERILVGRVVTAMMVPRRPDLNGLVEDTGRKEGRIGGQNSWVIDTLVPGDVMVVDMFGKIKEGTFVGDNLSTSLRAHTKAGAVIDGGVRDFQGILVQPDFVIFCRGIDPTPISETTLVGVNIPIRIGRTTVLPGDVVLGTVTGVVFVPPHLVQEVVERSEDIRMRDVFGKKRLLEGRYTPGEIDTKWTEQIEQDYHDWLRTK